MATDQFSEDGTGWARFSDDMTMRYRLARSLTGAPLVLTTFGGKHDTVALAHKRDVFHEAVRVVFLMLNPSTADAFANDRTIRRCVSFATAWKASALEVVNIDALRSTDPKELYRWAAGMRGDDTTNDEQIIAACTGAYRVIAGWGVHGALGGRGAAVRALLASRGVALHHLGLTKDGHPRHPLYLKGCTEPQEWNA